jgi:ParB/RepB/Spo0J family partition protein
MNMEEKETQPPLFAIAGHEPALASATPSENVQLIDPALCRPWEGNARHCVEFCPTRSRELVDSIAREGQRVPVILRPSIEHEGSYEIIAGMQRHGAVTHLIAQGADICLRATIVIASAEQAWRISETENAGRRDITPLQRARSWSWAMHQFHDGRQDGLAAAVGCDEATVCRTLSILSVPPEILKILAEPEAISINFASKLQAALRKEEVRKTALARAGEFAELGLRYSSSEALERLLMTPEERETHRPIQIDDVAKIAKVRLVRKPNGTIGLQIKPVNESLTKRERLSLLRSIESALATALTPPNKA